VQISALMKAYEAPDDAWLAMDTGTAMYKITVAQLKAAVTAALTAAQGGN
jgi:hypothetical protein